MSLPMWASAGLESRQMTLTLWERGTVPVSSRSAKSWPKAESGSP
jgi:hypothetical protein